MAKFRRREKPIPVPPVPQIRSCDFHITVAGEDGKALTSASISIHVDNDLGVFTSELINDNGYYKVTIPANIPKPYGADMVVSCEGYKNKTFRVFIPNEPNYDLAGGVRLEQNYPFRYELGKVTAREKFFWNNGDRWYMRGATMFMLFARYLRGEDITPQFEWLRRNGFNTARVLGPVDWGGEWSFYNKFNDWNRLHEFFALAYNHGLRVLWCPITTRQNASDHIELLRCSIEVAREHDNVLLQVCNEPLKDGKCDPVDLLNKVGQSAGITTDFGIYYVDDWPSNWPLADFGSVHLTREYPKFARKSKDLLELRNGFNKPFIHDEPIGVAEVDIPGRRTTDIFAVLDDAAVAMLCGNGWVYHFETGIQGLTPEPGSVQQKAADLICELYQFIPSNTNSGQYTAPHVGAFPIAWSESDSEVGHAYGMILGNTAYVVNIMPPHGWLPTGINGWRVDDVLHESVIRLIRG